MDGLSKVQRDELATAFAILALHDGGAEVSTDQINALLEATGNEVDAFYPIIFGNFASKPEKLSALIALPAAGGGGGGGGAGVAADAGGEAAAEEPKEEEKEEEMEAPAVDMFGSGGGGGDY